MAPNSASRCEGGGGGNNKADCEILLRVVEIGAKCKVQFVDPLQQDVYFELGNKDLWVLLQLAESPGYKFPKKGAVVVERDPLGNFKDGHAKGPRDQTFAIRNVNSRLWGAGEYPYLIFVDHPESGRVCNLDPWYRNR